MAHVGSLFDELSLGTKARLLILGTLDMEPDNSLF